MKKEYTNPTIEIVTLDVNDVVTASSYDPLGLLTNENKDNWYNE